MLAVKAIDEHRAEQAHGKGCTCIDRNNQAKLPGRNLEDAHELRAQRHDDHEIQDVGKLHHGQDDQQQAFVVNNWHGLGRFGFDHRNEV